LAAHGGLLRQQAKQLLRAAMDKSFA